MSMARAGRLVGTLTSQSKYNVVMPWPRILVLVYGLFLLCSGIEAAVSKGSVISLVAGGGLGVLALICFAIIPKNPRVGYIGATVVGLAVIGRFLPTYLKTQDIWPAGIMAMLSLVVVAALTAAHFLAKSKPANPEG